MLMYKKLPQRVHPFSHHIIAIILTATATSSFDVNGSPDKPTCEQPLDLNTVSTIFTKADIREACNGVKLAKLDVHAVKIGNNGDIIIITKETELDTEISGTPIEDGISKWGKAGEGDS